MVFSRFFQFLVKKPGFLVFSEKNEKTTNPGEKRTDIFGLRPMANLSQNMNKESFSAIRNK